MRLVYEIKDMLYDIDHLSKDEIKAILQQAVEDATESSDDNSVPNFQSMSKEQVTELMEEHNIIYQHGVFAMQIMKPSDTKHADATIPLCKIFIEDDGNLHEKITINSYWLDDLIRVAQGAKEQSEQRLRGKQI